MQYANNIEFSADMLRLLEISDGHGHDDGEDNTPFRLLYLINTLTNIVLLGIFTRAGDYTSFSQDQNTVHPYALGGSTYYGTYNNAGGNNHVNSRIIFAYRRVLGPVGQANLDVDLFRVHQRPVDVTTRNSTHHDPKGTSSLRIVNVPSDSSSSVASDRKIPRKVNRTPCARCKNDRKGVRTFRFLL